jgi:hypothetical protein
MRHSDRRAHLMLQWNSKRSVVLLVALVVAVAAVLGNFSWALFNFSW